MPSMSGHWSRGISGLPLLWQRRDSIRRRPETLSALRDDTTEAAQTCNVCLWIPRRRLAIFDSETMKTYDGPAAL